VRYGKLGWLGSFSAEEEYHRGEAVVLQTSRGWELGEVLLPALTNSATVSGARFPPGVGGSILRRATREDQQAAQEAQEAVHRLLPLLDTDAPPWLILDAEATLDRCCILHVLPASSGTDPDPATWLATWQARSGYRLEILDLSQLAPPIAAPRAIGQRGTAASASTSTGCSSCRRSAENGSSSGCSSTSGGCSSSGGCSTSGGCSSGSCGRGSIRPEELYAYFALLREHFQESLTRYPLL
jgi:uncharacterized membrane protein YgcG